MYTPTEFSAYVEDLYEKELKKCSDSSKAEAQYQVAITLLQEYETILNNKLYAEMYLYEIIDQLRCSVSENHSKAQCLLGNLLSRETRVKNENEALGWFAAAAAQGEQDAMAWLESRATENQDKEAQYIIGNIYLQGSNAVKRNITKGKLFLELAAKQDHAKAKFILLKLEKGEAGLINRAAIKKRVTTAVHNNCPKDIYAIAEIVESTKRTIDFDKDLLCIATERGYIEVIKALIAASVDVDTQNTEGCTPIFIAARAGNKASVCVLLAAGANASIITPFGTALEVAQNQNTPKHHGVIQLLQEYIKQYPNGKSVTFKNTHQEELLQRGLIEFYPPTPDVAQPSKAAKPAEKKTAMALLAEKIQLFQQHAGNSTMALKQPNAKEESESLVQPESRSVDKHKDTQIPTIETISTKILFSNALQTKIAELVKTRSKIEEAKRLSKLISTDIQRSSSILSKSLKDLSKNKDRHLKLEANLTDLTALEKHIASIEVQEKYIIDFLELLNKGCQRIKMDEELQKTLTSSDEKTKAKPFFTLEEFLEFQKALTAVGDECMDDELFKNGLITLEEKCNSLSNMAAMLFEALNNLSNILKNRVAEHSKFTTYSDNEAQPALALDKKSRINAAYAQITAKLEKIISDEKTRQDLPKETAQNQQTITSERRTAPNRAIQTRPTHPRNGEENEILPLRKLSKKERQKAYEERQTAKALCKKQRKAAYDKKQAGKIQEAQAFARARALEAIESGQQEFSRPEIKPETKIDHEEKIASENHHPLFKEKTIESFKALQKLKLVVKIASEKEIFASEIYAILQMFAYLNEAIATEHENHTVQNIARCLRNAVFNQHQAVMRIIESPRKLLHMVNTWVTFLEAPEKTNFCIQDLLSKSLMGIYTLGKELSREMDINKSRSAFQEMLNFRDTQAYGADCKIRLVSNKIKKFRKNIKNGLEIAIVKKENTFTVYYKNKNTCKISSFDCDENQKTLLSKLPFNNELLSKDVSTEEIYQQMYAVVSKREGCTCFGDDMIGQEAWNFYMAITGKERGVLVQAAGSGDYSARSLLQQFAPIAFASEHQIRSLQARHLIAFDGDSGQGNALASINTAITSTAEVSVPVENEPLLFARETFPCLAKPASVSVHLPISTVTLPTANAYHSG